MTDDESIVGAEAVVDRTSAANHAMELMMRTFPALHLRRNFTASIDKDSAVYVDKGAFMDAFHHSVPHVPKIAASYQKFLLQIGSMLHYKTESGGYVSTDSAEGRTLYIEYKHNAKVTKRNFESTSKARGMEGSRQRFENVLKEFVSFEDAMYKCLRVWDLEDDYMQISRVQNSLSFLQFWFRRHKKLQRAKVEKQASQRLSVARVNQRKETDLQRIKDAKSPKNSATGRSGSVYVVANENDDDNDRSKVGANVIGGWGSTSRPSSVSRKLRASMGGMFAGGGEGLSPRASKIGGLGGGEKSSSTISIQLQSQAESPSKNSPQEERTGRGASRGASRNADRGGSRGARRAKDAGSMKQNEDAFLDLSGGVDAHKSVENEATTPKHLSASNGGALRASINMKQEITKREKEIKEQIIKEEEERSRMQKERDEEAIREAERERREAEERVKEVSFGK